jgi:hypothetical protein
MKMLIINGGIDCGEGIIVGVHGEIVTVRFDDEKVLGLNTNQIDIIAVSTEI